MKHIFIINSFAGTGKFSNEIREKLKKIDNLDYFIFNVRYAGYEQELIRKLVHFFDDDYLRIYCCGGSGTLCNILNGIDDISKVEIAFYPCGLTNDFLKVFGNDEQYFRNIEALINGKVANIDYIEVNDKKCLNAISCGIDSYMHEEFKELKFLQFINKSLPYKISILRSILFTKPVEYIIKADDNEIVGRFSQIVFGNGIVFGGSIPIDNNASITDRKGKYILGPNQRGLSLLNSFIKMTRKNNDLSNIIKSNCCESFSIRRKDNKPFIMNLDGEIQPECISWNAKIIHKQLNFVVPENINI